MEWKPDITKYIYRHLEECKRKGITPIALQGARRSSKTYTICQFLLVQMLTEGDVCVFASMTNEQGRLGAYEDCKTILESMPAGISQYFDVMKTPREINCKSTPNGRQGRATFKSFSDAETAKGVACDWVFINEANKFSLQQYYDLAANARKGVIMDYNPQERFWVDKLDVTPLRCSWQKNREHLTEAQLQWFQHIYDAAHSPDATSADVYYYNVYYCGEYAELAGEIFTPANMKREQVQANRLRNFAIVADPSNLTGADYFPSVVVATDGARLYVVDVMSVNTTAQQTDVTDWQEWCKRWQPIVEQWRVWVAQYGVSMIFCEANGVGAEFIRYAAAKDVSIKPFYSRENKHRRILDNYDNLCNRVVWNDTDRVSEYLRQVYQYTGKDDATRHDDNIDCVSNAFDIFYKRTRLMV